jgi:hypothetical protein
MANIAFEMGKGLVDKRRFEKFTNYFTKKVLRRLEKNWINVCDPQVENFVSKFSKLNYKCPEEAVNSKINDLL